MKIPRKVAQTHCHLNDFVLQLCKVLGCNLNEVKQNIIDPFPTHADGTFELILRSEKRQRNLIAQDQVEYLRLF